MFPLGFPNACQADPADAPDHTATRPTTRLTITRRTARAVTQPLRTHQRLLAGIVQAIAVGQTEVRDILAAVTPGGGKSLLPVLAAARLIAAGVVDRVCWIVPRDSLRRQAEEAFTDPLWRAALDHGLAVRAADNAPDLCRGLAGYVTTYQAIAAAPDLHLAEFQSHRYLVALDELHHLPALSELDSLTATADETAWSRAILPLLETARVRLLMSGTLARADGKAILWLPYRRPHGRRNVRDIDLTAGHWAVIGYSRRQALAERAVLPVVFGALDGQAEWLDRREQPRAVPSLAGAGDRAHDALFTALRTGFAEALLRQAFTACRQHRAARRRALGLRQDEDARGLGKLLVVAPDQTAARHYADTLRHWVPTAAYRRVQLAVSDVADAHEAIAAFRMRPDPAVLVTVAMAYEGMDAPEVSHVACLTHIRSRPWLEQMIARATRVDPHGGAYDAQRAVVYHPDDPGFRSFRHAIETEQGTRARAPSRRRQTDLPFDRDGDTPFGITPLRSNATALRFDTVAPGPDFATRSSAAGLAGPRPPEPARPETPSATEHRLRQQIGQLVAAQVVEDRDDHRARRPDYHTYNAILKRVMGKSRATMTRAELEATLGWLERNRLSDHQHQLDGDPADRWSSARRSGRLRLGPHWI
jgi:superfamily II DNA or RNA helicase